MGADIKSLRTRIKSVRSTLQLTSAMGLVASSKIRKAQLFAKNSKEYANSVSSIVDVLTSSRECEKSPFMSSHGEKIKLVVIAGDRGLAGGYNANIFRYLRDYPDAELCPIGKKSCERFGDEIYSSEFFSYSDTLSLAKALCEEYKEGKYAKIGVLYTKYKSMISQIPDIKWILPLSKSEKQTQGGAIFEPDELTMLERAMPTYLSGIIYSLIKESFLCEVISRRNAMDSAGKNARQMIDSLQLEYNRARQGAITQEITEIVAGSDQS